ncbi:hypothetical protein FS749_000348 [Ceratobasidium sp. UAMH 11750]|nr:hypothetical protein FS749_000348 [Ceratobasidium sp. UAMH 11750]
MAAEALRKIVARLLPASSVDSTPPQMTNPILRKNPQPEANIELDVIQPTTQSQDIDDISCLKICDQNWNFEKNEWTETFRAPKIDNLSEFQKIVAYNRKDVTRDFMNHIWIEFRSKPMVELLKPYFRGLSGFAGLQPGVDARYVYNQRIALGDLVTRSINSTNTTREIKRACSELQTLLDYINDEFKDITAQLEDIRQESNPQIEWHLLWALFPKDGLVQTSDGYSEQGMAFRMESWVYEDNYVLGPSFLVRGKFLQWTGYKYAWECAERWVCQYAGMQRISRLIINPLTKSVQDKLTAYRRFFSSRLRRFEQKDPNDDNRLEIIMPRGISRGEEGDGVDFLSQNDLDVCLLPSILYGWSFTARAWKELFVENLSPIQFQPDTLKHLVLPGDHRELIQSLVEAQAGSKGLSLIRDIAPGKGGGLVLLLHGNPGTGKTLTAEAISEHLQLPLYLVSCSEFGINLEDVEMRLRNVLDITSLWKAVVLIDEADIFLEARSDNLTRNSIIGVFLRMLEYHSGILILTTNRVRKLDDAVRSRISLALRYPDLDRESRRIIWKQFLSLTGATIQDPSAGSCSTYDFSLEDIEELSERVTNGREIRNTVRIAQALAPTSGKRLNLNQVKRVWKICDDFDEDLHLSSSTEPVTKRI